MNRLTYPTRLVTDFVAELGWKSDASALVLDGLDRDAITDADGAHFILRMEGHPLLSATVVTSTDASRDHLHRVAANAAYNRHVRTGVLLTPDAADVVLARWIDSASVSAGEMENLDDSPLARPFVLGTLQHERNMVLEFLSPRALLAPSVARHVESLARRNGCSVRPSVDRALLAHCLTFRSEVLRADRSSALSVEERAHFDAMLVGLMTRLLFVRHLEDRELAGWKRGVLRDAVRESELAVARVAELFGSLQSRFNSELFPAAHPAAYRMPALDGSALRRFVGGLYDIAKFGARYNFALLEADSLGLIYQQFAGVRWPGDAPAPQLRLLQKDSVAAVSTRDPFGVFYTPPAVVDTILALTLRAWLVQHGGEGRPWPRLLDLTAGSGVFLSRAFDHLLDAMGPLDPQQARSVIEQLHGVDIDRRAISLARLNVWMTFARHYSDARLPSLADTIRVGDSLADASAASQDEIRALPEAWQQRGFDLIVGNPPFLGHRDALAHFGAARVQSLHARHRVAVHEVNFAALFVERGLRLLRPGGYLGMVLPRNLLKTESGDALRRLLRHTCEIVTIIDCLDSPLFPDADAHSVILVARRPSQVHGSARAGAAFVLPDARVDVFAPIASSRHLTGFDTQRVLHGDLDVLAEHRIWSAAASDKSPSEPVWCLLDGAGRCTLERLLDPKGLPLREFVRSHYAVDEGLRGAFVLTGVRWHSDTVDGYSSALHEVVRLERELFRPALRPSDLRPLGQAAPATEAAILYPYDAATGTVTSFDEIRRSFPRTARYLRALEVPLRNRRGHGASDGWWVPRAVRPAAPWHIPRPRERQVVLARHGEWPVATLAPSTIVPVGASLVLEVEARSKLTTPVLLALTSSRLWWWFVMVSGTVGRGKFYRIRLSSWRNLRVPGAVLARGTHVRELTRLARALSDPTNSDGASAALWEQLDEVVEDAYGLSRAERAGLRDTVAVYSGRPRAAWLRRGDVAEIAPQTQLFE